MNTSKGKHHPQHFVQQFLSETAT